MKNISPKEAIEVLKDMKIETPLPKAAVTQRKRNAAIEMAIDVLKYSELQNSSDLISRQVAIDKAIMIPVARIVTEDKVIWRKAVFVEDIEALPSAQPRWIPWDSGRFPEESGTYTVTAYDGVTNRVTYAKYQKRLKQWELTGARAYWRVLAWMPHIEPWEGGQDGV